MPGIHLHIGLRGGLHGFHDDDNEGSGFLGDRGGWSDHEVGRRHCHRGNEGGEGRGRRTRDSVPNRSIELVVVVSPVVRLRGGM